MSVLRCPSAVSPIHRACDTTTFYSHAESVFPSIKDVLNNRSIHSELLPRRVSVVFQIAFLYCCRISELLDCTVGNHVPPDRLVCKGKKGSNAYIIYLPGLSKFIHDTGDTNVNRRIFPFTYGYLYRWALKVGIPVRLSKRSNNAVLHLSRYVFSHKCTDRNLSAVVGECLRHRSKETASYYLNKGVQSNG